MTITAIISAPQNAQQNVAFTATSSITDARDKAIRVGVGEQLFVDKNIPHEFTVNYLDGTSITRLAYVNNNDEFAVNAISDNWLSGSDDGLIFGSDNQILEGTI